MNKIRKINNIVSTILLILCFIYLIITLGPRLLGYEVNVVLSNSMEPVYSTGELLLVKPAKADEIKVNDIISFKGSGVSGNVITHRVIKIDQEKQVFITKGDANSSQDSIKWDSKDKYSLYRIYLWNDPINDCKNNFGWSSVDLYNR